MLRKILVCAGACLFLVMVQGAQNGMARTRFDTASSQINRYYKSKQMPDIYDKLFGIKSMKYRDEFDELQKQLLFEQRHYDRRKFPVSKYMNKIENERKRVDIGIDFLRDVIWKNNRLDYYDLYIKLAKANGYNVISYEDYLTNYMGTRKKVLILRHDIDITNDATRYMYEIEKENGVKATYYFRWSSFDKKLIEDISAQGFEVGLHYETIATYCKKNNKYVLDDADYLKCRELLKEEIKKFEQITGIDVKTIASHGDGVNRKIGIPNYILLKGQAYEEYGIIGETYDSNIIKNYIKSYICDAELMKNGGFSYHTDPISSILNGDQVIEFLSHPNHWNYDQFKRAKYLIDVERMLKRKEKG